MKIKHIALIGLAISGLGVCRSYAQTTIPNNPLAINRQKIDSLDKMLIQILGERERVVKEIGIYKAKNNIPSLQAGRFQQVLDKGIEAGKKEGLSPEFITELLNAIHKESLRIEDDLKLQNSH